jgi:hypothetical protein
MVGEVLYDFLDSPRIFPYKPLNEVVYLGVDHHNFM